MRTFCVVLLVLITSSVINANDSAASVALGGIQLRREPRITMLKEKLVIGIDKVTVEYEFLNESNSPITTDVAFPIPSYWVYDDFRASGIRDFDDFKLWVDGTQLRYAIDARARLNGRDVSKVLRQLSIDVGSLGHYDGRAATPFSRDFRKLSQSQQETLTEAGLFDRDDHFPQWRVEKTYYWRQTFPPHKILRVRHEYRPGFGFRSVEQSSLSSGPAKRVTAPTETAEPGEIDNAKLIESACIDHALLRTLTLKQPHSDAQDDSLSMMWVDYILTTANSWKTPIRDFELEVEKPYQHASWYAASKWWVSFCWDGPVQRIDADHFRAKAANFVPRKELRVVFFGK